MNEQDAKNTKVEGKDPSAQREPEPEQTETVKRLKRRIPEHAMRHKSAVAFFSGDAGDVTIEIRPEKGA